RLREYCGTSAESALSRRTPQASGVSCNSIAGKATPSSASSSPSHSPSEIELSGIGMSVGFTAFPSDIISHCSAVDSPIMQKHMSKIIPIVLALLLSACGSTSKDIDETKNWSPSKLYAEARDEMNTGNYERAIQHFEKLESRYPFGTYAQQAQMEIAYAYYRQGEQAQALAAIERFIKLHPDHPNVDYMYYLRGLVNFNDRVSIFDIFSRQDPTERDQKAVREAFDSFKLLVERFPNSQYTPDARDRMAYLVNAMARYDVHVADYYYRRGAYVAAAARAQS